jgi:hypothetical protein
LNLFIIEFNQKIAAAVAANDSVDGSTLLDELKFLKSIAVEEVEDEDEEEKKKRKQNQTFVTYESGRFALKTPESLAAFEKATKEFAAFRSQQQFSGSATETEAKGLAVYDRSESVSFSEEVGLLSELNLESLKNLLLPEEVGLLSGLNLESLESLKNQNSDNSDMTEDINSLLVAIGKIKVIADLLQEEGKEAEDMTVELLFETLSKVNSEKPRSSQQAKTIKTNDFGRSLGGSLRATES